MTSEENKIEELLKPRRKVIALYPLTARDWGTALEIGRILTHPNISWAKNVLGFDVEDFPHLFEPLPWYAERKVEDLPVYLKNIYSEAVFKIEFYKGDLCKSIEGETLLTENFLPTSFEEYQSYISKTKIL